MVSTIMIGEDKYPVKFTYNALIELEQYFETTLLGLSEMLSNGSVTTQLKIAEVGIKHGVKASGKKMEISIEELGDIIQPKTMIQIIEIFTKDTTIDDEEKEEKKDDDVPEDGKKK